MQAISMTPSAALARPLESPLASNRLFYLDSLKVALTILVVLHHVGQAYGPTGGAWPAQEVTRTAVLGPFFAVNRSFFMSLFFMISGYFMVGAFERKGFGKFIKSRLVRLGIPVLVYAAFSVTLGIFVFHEQRGWNDVFDVGPCGTSSTFCSSPLSTLCGVFSVVRRTPPFTKIPRIQRQGIR